MDEIFDSFNLEEARNMIKQDLFFEIDRLTVFVTPHGWEVDQVCWYKTKVLVTLSMVIDKPKLES